ncbi:MAG: NAD(P)/FAD-dependent oxidoreductase [Verrucomicrobia bacterium]|nr:NAD(P)/FAD-dependent oxidoreductase [Verrucomicrobiota bacterium]
MKAPLSQQHYDAIIIGAGAAGLFCSFQAAQRGNSVLLLEHNDRVGKKIGISGGGRCNFTNIHTSAENYLSENPNFCKSALARFSPWDFITLVEKHGIAYHEKKLGQQFCDASSREIIDMLLIECHEAGVKIVTSCHVQNVSKEEKFHLMTSRGSFTADSLVIATGGLSFPKLGATDFGYRIARQFGIAITPLRPALVPLTFVSHDRNFCNNLAGVSLPVRVEHCGIKFEEALLFTHRGVSGPAILQISSTWKPGEELIFDLLPDSAASSQLLHERQSQALLPNILSHYLPRRFAEAWCERHHFTKTAHHCSDQEFSNFLQLLHHWPMRFLETEGYPKAEVTCGGVSTSELSSKRMESRKVSGLYFIGEVVDVTGWLGGYNFQWAWASAHAAAEAL